MAKINIYKYYKSSFSRYPDNFGQALANLNEEQFEAFSKWQKIQALQDKLNYLNNEKTNLRSMNPFSQLYNEAKSRGERTSTLLQVENEINLLQSQLKELKEGEN